MTTPSRKQTTTGMTARTQATDAFFSRAGAFAFVDPQESYDVSSFAPASLVREVVDGGKRATAGLAIDYVDEPAPRVGRLSVVLDERGNPACLLRTVEVFQAPVRDVPLTFGWEEGEGDRSLAYWSLVHEEYFRERCAANGVPYDDTVQVVFQRFELVYPLAVSGTVVIDGAAVEHRPGDSVAITAIRAGRHPGGDGGPLCLAGDCPNCLCIVDGVPYTRACQTPARPGMVVERQPAHGAPGVPARAPGVPIALRHTHVDVLVIGRGRSGRDAARTAAAGGRTVRAVDQLQGEEAMGVYPAVVALRTPGGIEHVHAKEVIVATGSYEVQPVAEGARLEGILTPRAGALLAGASLLPTAVSRVSLPEMVLRFEGDRRVQGVVVRTADGGERREACDAVIVDLGRQARDGLARQGADRVVGAAAATHPLPPPPTSGVVCPCTGTTVDDLADVWARGFHDIELLKRATLACTGTCQGAVCLPHVRAWVGERAAVPPPFTARPLTRQPTLEEAAAGFRFPPTRRTALDEEHRALGARMERFGGWWRPWSYGDTLREYWAVRGGVSVMDVGTLGKSLIAGPDATRFLERLYPCQVGDLAVGRLRYALLLNEAGYVIDDGLIARLAPDRYALTFTTGGGTSIDPWLRDWAASFSVDVRIMDRTAAEGAINVTGPNAETLLRRLGVTELPPFMAFASSSVAGVRCRILRLGFTGEASFELHHDADRSVALWRALLAAGEPLGIRPHGLDALLTLRLEKGHVIVGQDTDFDSTPRRLGMSWAQRSEKPDFVGRAALARIDPLVLDRSLVALTFAGGAPLEGSVLRAGTRVVGNLTSARWSPALRLTVALGWVDRINGELPAEVTCDGRAASFATAPFYDAVGERLRG